MYFVITLLSFLILCSSLTSGFFLLKEKIAAKLCKFCPLYCSPRRIDFDIDGLTSMIAEDSYDVRSDHIPYFRHLDPNLRSANLKPTTSKRETKHHEEPWQEDFSQYYTPFQPFWEHTTTRPTKKQKRITWESKLPLSYDQYTFPWEQTAEKQKQSKSKTRRQLQWEDDIPYVYDPRGPFLPRTTKKPTSQLTTKTPERIESQTFDYDYSDLHYPGYWIQLFTTTQDPTTTEEVDGHKYLGGEHYHWKPSPKPTTPTTSTTTTTTTTTEATTTESPSGICMFCEKYCNFPPKDYW